MLLLILLTRKSDHHEKEGEKSGVNRVINYFVFIVALVRIILRVRFPELKTFPLAKFQTTEQKFGQTGPLVLLRGNSHYTAPLCFIILAAFIHEYGPVPIPPESEMAKLAVKVITNSRSNGWWSCGIGHEKLFQGERQRFPECSLASPVCPFLLFPCVIWWQ